MSQIIIMSDEDFADAAIAIEESEELAENGSTDDELEALHEVRDHLHRAINSSHDGTALLESLIEQFGVQWVELHLKSLGARNEFDTSDVIA